MKICGMVAALLSLNYLIGGDLVDAAFIGVGIAVVMGLDMYLSAIPEPRKWQSAWQEHGLSGCRMGIIADPFHVMVVTAIGLVPGIC